MLRVSLMGRIVNISVLRAKERIDGCRCCLHNGGGQDERWGKETEIF
jgi:hypothetical protein